MRTERPTNYVITMSLYPPVETCTVIGTMSVIIVGNNGREYQFLLKGHEDLRQDERVMQLFGLVNSLLLANTYTCRRNLT